MGIIGLGLLATSFIGYIIMISVASIEEGGIALLVISVLAGCLLLFAQALKDRLNNSEDNYYAKNVEK